MQRIKSAAADLCCVTPSEIHTELEGLFRETDLDPCTIAAVLFEIQMYGPRLLGRNVSPKDLLLDSMRHFSTVEGRKPYRWAREHQRLGLR